MYCNAVTKKVFLAVLFFTLFLTVGTVQAEWNTQNYAATVRLSHEIDQMLHDYHQYIEKLKPQHFDKDFANKVHDLDHAIHDFHEFLTKNKKAKAEDILEDFKGIELKYRESQALFIHLAHSVHSDKDAGLQWMDFKRKMEELHFLVTGHFSWQDVELDHHQHDHDHDIKHGADHGHDH